MASKQRNTVSLEKKLYTEELVKKLARVNANWSDGSPKSATAILAEAIAIVSGRQ